MARLWVVLWMLFATTLNVSLRWLRSSVALTALFGGIGGPLAFYGGAKLGGVNFLDYQSGLTALAIGWAVMTPMLVLLATRLDGAPVATEGRAHV